MRTTTYEHYMEELASRAVLPEGFSVSTAPITFMPRERQSAKPYAMNVSLISAREPTSCFAGVFTRSAFPGAPVLVGRRRLEEPVVRGILINNRVANVCAPDGEADIDRLLTALASRLGGQASEYFSASTGIIGWRLPVTEMLGAMEPLVRGLSPARGVELAKAIMTTDSYPKIRAARVGRGRMVGFAKGAGMIEPNMATMLSFILCDCSVDRDELRRILARCVDATFNRITVDSDQSTSDMVLLLCSGCRGASRPEELEAALLDVCGRVAEDVVRNGEGVGHVVKIRVAGARDEAMARDAAKAVANSPLVKTAVFGNDPNVGRIVGALGDYIGNAGMGSARLPVDPLGVRVSMAGELVFSDGAFRLSPELEHKLAVALERASMPTTDKRFPPHEECVEVLIELGSGPGSCEVIGADLSYDYVKENADYRT